MASNLLCESLKISVAPAKRLLRSSIVESGNLSGITAFLMLNESMQRQISKSGFATITMFDTHAEE